MHMLMLMLMTMNMLDLLLWCRSTAAAMIAPGLQQGTPIATGVIQPNSSNMVSHFVSYHFCISTPIITPLVMVVVREKAILWGLRLRELREEWREVAGVVTARLSH